MTNFLSNYISKKKFEESKTLCNLANILILNREKGARYLQEFFSYHPEIKKRIIKRNSPPPTENKIKKNPLCTVFGVLDAILGSCSFEIPMRKGWKQPPEWYIALELCREAFFICPENFNASWMIIQILHWEGLNDEAFIHFSTVSGPGQKWSEYDIASMTPAILGMLISVGKKQQAINLLTNISDKFSDTNFKKMLLFSLSMEPYYLKIDELKEYIDLIKNIDASLLDEHFADTVSLKARSFINNDNLKEARVWINLAVELRPNDQRFLTIKQEIENDLKEGNTWDSIKTEDEFFQYLFRRLAHRFHPDLAKNDTERAEKTKIMSEINKARSDNNLQELKKIAQECAPDWIKYFKF